LHDGADFQNEEFIHKLFSNYINIDFMKYHQRTPLLDKTIKTLIYGYNQTPENFGAPSEEVIDEVISAIDE